MWQDIIAIIIAVICGMISVRMIYRSVVSAGSCGCSKCPSKKPQMIDISPIDSIQK